MSSRTTVPFGTIFAILILALSVFWPVVGKLPSLANFWRVPSPRPLTLPQNRVWVSRRSGLYYCHRSALYGKLMPGTYMDQEEANQVGYSPAVNAGCAESPIFGASGPARRATLPL
jgi:hypothetical protein